MWDIDRQWSSLTILYVYYLVLKLTFYHYDGAVNTFHSIEFDARAVGVKV